MHRVPKSEHRPRPPVSVVLPFAGNRAEFDAAIAELRRIELEKTDEIIIVDNSRSGGVGHEMPGVCVVRAWREASSYYARNEGAEVARGEWLLFVDADCRPEPDIIDCYFSSPVADEVGAVVGEVLGAPEQSSLVSRYARSRGHLGQEVHFRNAFRPWGVTANLLVRRSAWESVGGFQEGIRSAGDTEFSWRIQDAGWRLEFRPEARVEHEHRESVRKLARQAARYGAGRGWVLRRYSGAMPRPAIVAPLARCLAGIVVWSALGRFERARFKGLDAIYITAEWASFWLSPNRLADRSPPVPAEIGVLAGRFPSIGEPEAVPPDAHIESINRPTRVDRRAATELAVRYTEDDGGLQCLLDSGWMLLRRPRVLLPALRTTFRLAPAARRLARSGVRELIKLPDAPAGSAQLLSRLLGVPVRG